MWHVHCNSYIKPETAVQTACVDEAQSVLMSFFIYMKQHVTSNVKFNQSDIASLEERTSGGQNTEDSSIAW